MLCASLLNIWTVPFVIDHLQDGHMQSFSPASYRFVYSLPRNQLVCVTSSVKKSGGVSFLRLGYKSCGFSLGDIVSLSLITCSEGYQLSYCKDTHSPRWGPHRKKQRPTPTPSSHVKPGTVAWMNLGADFSGPSRPLRWPQCWLTAWLQPHERHWAGNILPSLFGFLTIRGCVR